jgi:hypothetical protein
MLCGESAKSQVLDCRETQSLGKAISMARLWLRLPLAEGFDKRRSMKSAFPERSLWKTRNRRNKLSSNVVRCMQVTRYMNMNRTTTPVIGMMSLLAFASCDQSPSLSSAPASATPSAEEARQQALARQRAAKSEKLGQDMGSSAVIPVIGTAMALNRRPQIPTQSEFDELIEKATAGAKNSDPDLDADAFRTGYITGYKLGFKVWEDEHRPAF